MSGGPQNALRLLALFAAGLAAVPAASEEMVTVQRLAGAEAVVAALPGDLLDFVPSRDAAGRPGLALLVTTGEKEETRRSVLFLDPAARKLVPLAEGLPREIRRLAQLAPPGGEGSGPGWLLLRADDGLYRLSGGKLRRVLDLPDGQDVSMIAGRGRAEGFPGIALARAGRVDLLGVSDSGSGLARQGSHPLPLRAERKSWGLRLTSPPVHLLPAGGGEPARLAVGPELHGKRRLRTLLLPVEPAAEAAEAGGAAGAGPVEVWALLPGDERLLESELLRVEGRPALAVTTLEKFGVFVKKRFRLFFLEADRSRQGVAPALAADTDCFLWQPLRVHVGDADGDGREDLMLIHLDGMGGGEVKLRLFRGLGGGRFEDRPQVVEFESKASGWDWGADLTGDGVPDLAVLGEAGLQVYPGRHARDGRGRFVETRPTATLATPESAEGPPGQRGSVRVGPGSAEVRQESDRIREVDRTDVDGDGRADLVARGGRWVAVVLGAPPR